jgi:ribosomal protein S18 acetylase RimI-like enzyme
MLPLILAAATNPVGFAFHYSVNRAHRPGHAVLFTGRTGRSAAAALRCRDSYSHSEIRDFVAASLRVKPLVGSSRSDCMSVAALRCGAFFKDLSVDGIIQRRFDLLRVVRERMKKGATCLVATIHGPFPPGMLSRLEECEELQSEADRAALQERQQLLLLTPKEGACGHNEIAAKLADNLLTWQESTRERSILVGAVDISQHEFESCDTWRHFYQGPSFYISEMAVDAGFRRLGIGAQLLSGAVELARSSDGDVFLHVEERNTPAISVYQSAGFRQEPDNRATLDLFGALCLHEETHHNILLRLQRVQREPH